MARKTKAEKAFEKAYDQAFRTQANCVQFNIMDLGKMRKAVYAAAETGTPVTEAMTAAIAQFRMN